MASRGGSSSDDDEDFGPVLPGVQPTAPSTTVSAPAAELQKVAEAPPLKRERHDPKIEEQVASTTSSPPAVSATQELPARAAAEVEKEAWESFVRLRLPSAALYERSFQHTSLQETYDAVAARSLTNPDETKASPGNSLSAAAPAHTVHDMCVHYDALGALVATIDAVGVVRVWRKLPRGIFFITELDKIFKFAHSSGDASGAPQVRRVYWAHAYAALQLLVFVCVEEEEEVLDEKEEAEVKLPHRAVRVHLRQINPVTFTVEARHSFSFNVPVMPMAKLTPAEVHPFSSSSAASSATAPPYALAYTRRPVFLTHQYTPHIAFFVTLPAPVSSSPSSSSSIPASAGAGGSGVVLCPCFPSVSVRAATSTLASPASVHYAATKLSVAHPIVLCVQQTAGVERAGTAPCVLVDAAGVVDYCTIEAAPAAAEAAEASSGLTLKVIAGLAAVPAASREARVWREWVRFDRRQRTGFFRLIRDAQQAVKDTQAQRPAATVDAQLIPCAVRLTSNGRYVVLWSTRVIREVETATATAARQTRIPSTQRTHALRLELCLHVFDFPTGACVGACADALPETITADADIGVRVEDWVAYIHQRSRFMALQMHVEECPSSSTFYVLVPEVSSAQLLSSRSNHGGAPADTATAKPASFMPDADAARGRQMRVYIVSLPESSSTSSASVTDAARGPAGATGATIQRLSHSPGEWEVLLRQPTPPPPSLLSVPHVDTSLPAVLTTTAMTTAAAQGTALRLHFTSAAEEQQSFHARGDSRKSEDDDEFASRNARAQKEKGSEDNEGEGAACQLLCRAPLLLLRRAVAPSQDLKNLIAASPLGAALGSEARKQLFLIPPSTASATAQTDGAEALLLTTSREPKMACLLVYSSELPFTAAAMRRFLSRPARNPEGEEQQQRGQTRDSSSGACESLEVDAAEEQARLWSQVCQDLHRERDYACGSLLMTTVAAPSAEQQQAANDASAFSQAAAGSRGEGAQAAAADGSPGSGPAHTVEGSTTAAAPVRAGKPSSPEAYVLELLKDVMPQLGSAPDAGRPALPVVLVHVRGYGTVHVHLLPSIAPLAVENFIRLSRRHYYDRLTFHRVIPHVIVQGGCPRGDGTGGESAFDKGAPFQDEGHECFPFFDHTAEKRCCWLCMANAGPNTNGSQFFFTVPGGEAMPWLNGHHTVFGFAVEGLDVVRAISVAARDEEDKPLSPIVIERVDVLSS